MTSTQYSYVRVCKLSSIRILLLSWAFEETFSCYLPLWVLIRVFPACDAERINEGLFFHFSFHACYTSYVVFICDIEDLLWFNLGWLLLWAQRGKSMGKRIINSLWRCVKGSWNIICSRVLCHSLEETHPLGCTDRVLEIIQTIGLDARWWAFTNWRAFIREGRYGWIYFDVLRRNVSQACSLRAIR